MKNLFSIFILCAVFFFNSCSNPDQNQNAEAEDVDSGVLIASNDQNLNLKESISIIEKATEEKPETQIEKPLSTVSRENTKQLKNISQTQKTSSGKAEKSKENSTKKVKEVQTEKNILKEKIALKTELNEAPIEKSKELKAEKPKTKKNQFSHEKWNQLLQKYVSASGKVNYKGFKSDNAKLEAYLNYLGNNAIQSNWSKAKKMAYWINAYNAFTIKLIVDNYPVSSITKLHGGKPWDYKWIKLTGKTYTLNNLENDILRPKYKDARIHFAVNCAAQSCPPITNKAWTESNLNELLEKQAKAFVNNPKYNSITSSEVEISKIFEWYAVDFGNIIDFLNKYSTTKIDKNAKVKYKEYNWNLNE